MLHVNNIAGFNRAIIPTATGGLWLGNLPGGLSKQSDGSWAGMTLPAVNSSASPISGNSYWNVFNRTSKTNFVTDSTALRNTTVLEFDYSGATGGNAPGTIYGAIPTSTKVYQATYFKYSSDFVPNSTGIDKWLFLQTAGSTDVTCLMFGGSSPFELRDTTEYAAEGGETATTAQSSGANLHLNTWYLLEWYHTYATTNSSADGTMKLWINGTLQVSRTNVQTPNGSHSGWAQVEFSPTWGGSNGPSNPVGTIHFDSYAVYTA